MTKEAREEAEYNHKLRRDSRKTVDKIYKAYKRRLLEQTDTTTAEAKLPTLKIDIMPVGLEGEIIPVADLKASSHTITAQHSILPQGLGKPTVGGLVINAQVGMSGAFDELYIGANGHIALRSERLFRNHDSTKAFSPTTMIKLMHSMVAIAKNLYSQADNDGPWMVRIELVDIAGWQISDSEHYYFDEDEDAIVLLPRYVVQKELDTFNVTVGSSTASTALTLGGEMLWQLGASA